MNYALIGLGAAGSAFAVTLAQRGHTVSGWFDSDPDVRISVEAAGGLTYEGIAGQGALPLPPASTDAAAAIDGKGSLWFQPPRTTMTLSPLP